MVAELHRVNDALNWVRDLDGLAAITWTTVLSASGVLLDRGNGYVAVEWDGMAVVGVYVSPNSDLIAFEDFLDGVGECVRRCLPRQMLVLGGFQRPLLVVGKCQVGRSWEKFIRLGCRTRAPTGDQGLGEHICDVERILRDRRHMGYLRGLQENFQLESGRRGRDSVRPPLYTDGGGRRRDNVCRYTGQQSPRSEPFPPTTKVASQGEGQGDAPGGSLRLRLELGRTKNVGKRRRGSRKTPKGHERGV